MPRLHDLELIGIDKSFATSKVLSDISISLKNGEILSILGPSGCGKTTLLNLILGLEQADAGKILYEDREVNCLPMEKRGFNIVFQDYALFPHLSVDKNIRYGLANKKGLTSEAELAELIDLLDLGPHLKKRIDQLSGGQKQRVALARTLVMKPKILLLDEPLSALDGMIKEGIKQRIIKIAKQMNLMTIIVTHDPEEALTMSDKVLILEKGRVAQFGTREEIVASPANSFVKNFILEQLESKKENIMKLFAGKKEFQLDY
ncbi:ABC transporter ATP-binding protein [Lactococcus termiticola]|uniref:ABC-type quaternary amine transporter n=1 Tax=Lactococcus termiticola TaxID=2169526 RepID=A0A2R5HEL9_9LACT|nr:ABC transporter ATP-binding protein [Lactococcus termiticola]GBG96256.1 spermidine/putrescine ABC transporter ATP-binding protein [Lactococcus termiticola]